MAGRLRNAAIAADVVEMSRILAIAMGRIDRLIAARRVSVVSLWFTIPAPH